MNFDRAFGGGAVKSEVFRRFCPDNAVISRRLEERFDVLLSHYFIVRWRRGAGAKLGVQNTRAVRRFRLAVGAIRKSRIVLCYKQLRGSRVLREGSCVFIYCGGGEGYVMAVLAAPVDGRCQQKTFRCYIRRYLSIF